MTLADGPIADVIHTHDEREVIVDQLPAEGGVELRVGLVVAFQVAGCGWDGSLGTPDIEALICGLGPWGLCDGGGGGRGNGDGGGEESEEEIEEKHDWRCGSW